MTNFIDKYFKKLGQNIKKLYYRSKKNLSMTHFIDIYLTKLGQIVKNLYYLK